MIYFDNAATSFPKPPSVYAEVNKCIRRYCGNPGRSGHRLSLFASEKIYESRELVSNFLSCYEPERVVFCQNASYALNLAIKNLSGNINEVLISDIEHNSVLRVVDKLMRDGKIKYRIFPHDADEKALEDYFDTGGKLVVANAVSNVNGCENSLKSLSKLRQKLNFKLIIDASQMLGHKRFSFLETPCDVLCAPSHKALFGIQGSGFAVFYTDPLPGSFIEGGSGNDSKNRSMPELLPERFEAGTLPTPSIVSLAEGIKYINEIGIDDIEEKLNFLTDMCVERICSLKRIKFYGAKNGLVSFNIDSYPSNYTADILDKNGIYVRSGLHCAPLAHERFGTLENGSVRISLSYLNTKKEIDCFYKLIKSTVSTI